MRLHFTSIILICVLSSLAQQDTLVFPTVEKSEVSKRVARSCEELKVPFHKEANLELLEFAIEWRGTPYRYGGTTKKGTDCSGFTLNAYQEIYQKTIPRVSRDVYAKCLPIKKHALYQGDLVFFATAGDGRVTHLGIYLWDGYFVHASSSKGVMVSNLKQKYWQKAFVSGGAWLD